MRTCMCVCMRACVTSQYRLPLSLFLPLTLSVCVCVSSLPQKGSGEVILCVGVSLVLGWCYAAQSCRAHYLVSVAPSS